MKKNTKVFALAGVGALTLVGGTFAYYTASQTFNNPFNTTNYGTTSVEKFNPSDGQEWKPGAEVDKKVYATNTGKGDVWVRVKFDEKWMRNGAADPFKEFSTADEGFFVAEPEEGKDPNAKTNQDDAADGLTEADEGSVVYKKLVTDNMVEEKDNETAKKWYFLDGYYYYTSALITNESTETLLDSVTLCADTDMGLFDKNTYHKVVEKGSLPPNFDAESWTLGECDFDASLKGDTDNPDYATKYEAYLDKDVYTYKEDKLNEEKQGYANADYELDITVEFVQADAEAADTSAWGWYPGKTIS